MFEAYLNNMVFADEDVGGSKVAVDVVLRLQILHTLTTPHTNKEIITLERRSLIKEEMSRVIQWKPTTCTVLVRI